MESVSTEVEQNQLALRRIPRKKKTIFPRERQRVFVDLSVFARPFTKGAQMISVGRYRFDGPLYDLANLRPLPGFYVILDRRPNGHFVLDIGESESISERLLNHERRASWQRAQSGVLAYALLYLPVSGKQQRLLIEAALRTQYFPTCGVR